MPSDPRIGELPKATKIPFPVQEPMRLKLGTMPGQQFGCLAILGIMLAFLGPLGLGLLLSDRGKNLLPMALGFVTAFPVLIAVIYPLSRFVTNKLAALDQEILKPAPGSTYVGVAFSDCVTTLNNDTAWDRGFQRIENGNLVYEGHNTRFDLPVQFIKSVVAKHHGDNLKKYPCVFVEWDNAGKSEYVYVEFRLGATTENYDACQKFVKDLTHAKTTVSVPPTLVGALPITSSQFTFSNVPSGAALDWKDYTIAFFITFAVGLSATLVADFVFKIKSVGGIAGGLSVVIFFGVLQARMAAKKKSD